MKKILLYLAAAFCFLLISNSAFAQIPVISYVNPVTLAANQAITITPTNTGGAATSWTLASGTVPAGMTFSTANGTISGTPTTTGTSALTITATNGSGTTAAFSLSITVATGNTVQPVISYDTPDIYVVGNAVNLPVTNSNSANTTSYSITGTLPAGLTFNTATGLISGTTTAVTVAAGVTVTITATTGVITGNTTVNITVNVGPPVISYTPSTNVYTVGTAITPLTPANTGGAVNIAGNAYGVGTVVASAGVGAAGMAVDAAGDVFVANPVTNTVTEYSAAGAVTTTSDAGGPVGLVFDAAGDAFVLDQATNSVVEYPVATGLAGAGITIITGLSTPTGIAIDASGNLYVANSGNGTITKYTVTTWALALTITANTGTNNFNRRAVSGGIAVDAAGNIYVIDNTGGFFGFGGSKIDEYNSAGTYVKSFREGNNNSAIYISPTSTNIFITSTGFRRGVTGYSAGFGQNIANERTGLTNPQGVVTDAAGDLFVSDATTGNITEYPEVKGYVISGTLPAGLTFNTTTGVISGTPLTTFPPTTYTITAYNVSGGGSTTVTISCVANPPVISYTPNPAVYVNPVTTIDNLPITTSGPAVIAAGFGTGIGLTGAAPSAPWGMTKDAAGDIWVVNGNGTVSEFGPTGAFLKTITLTGTAGALSGITINTTTGTVYVSSTTGGVYSFASTATGTVAAATVANTGANLQGIVYSPVTGYLYATSAAGAVYRISTTGGRFNFARTLITGLGNATGITVDASGNIYVLTLNGTLTEYSSAGVFERTALSGLGSSTYGLYIDASGDTYIAGGGTVNEYNVAGTLISTGTSTITTSGTDSRGVVTDASGDVYVADHTANTVTEYAPSTYYVLTGAALPAGLTFNPATGLFSIAVGTAPFGPLTFTVTAYGSSGTATTNVIITCTNGPIITYTTPDIYTDGTLITPLTPVSTGTAVVSYVSTTLPPGLSISPTTGVISGTPTTATPATAYVVTATDAAGKQGTFTITITTLAGPPAFTYTTPDVYVQNTAIAALSPVITGSTPTSYSISATLPTGLTFSTTTGVISGTPTVTSPVTPYIITGTNSAGSATFTVNISVVSIPVIAYTTPDIYTVGTVIATLSPVNTGSTPVSYAISTPLPTGLTFNTTNGQISGTPTVVSATTSYIITATNANGSGTFTISITVNPAAPIITYTTPDTYTVGTAITPLVPVITGGTPTGFTVSGLPAGLSIDPVTGVISGTPTAASTATVYTVTATNGGGNGTFNITITVTALGPIIAYTSPVVLPVGVAITPLTPANTGSTPVSYTISGTWPVNGLAFNTTTGIISGTPAAAAGAITYTVTAKDAAGNTGSTTITIICASYVDWIGVTSSDWNTASNWAQGTVPSATGLAGIGVNQTFKNFPTVTGALSVGSVVIGSSSTIVNVPASTSQAGGFTVVSGSSLSISGPITYQSDANSGLGLVATISGAGSVIASGINVNANTTLGATYTQTLASSVASLTLTTDIAFISTNNGATTFNAKFNITGGTAAVYGIVSANNSASGNSTLAVTPATTATLQLANVTPLTSLYSGTGTNTLDFDHPGATVEYSGAAQIYYTDLNPATVPLGVSYNSIKFSGTGVKTPNGTTANYLNIDGDFTNALTLNDALDYIDLSKPTVFFDGTTADNIYAGNGTGTTFYNVQFAGDAVHPLTVTIQSGGAFVASSGVLTMGATAFGFANPVVLAAGAGLLTLNSDFTGSATVATIPSNCSISGTVNVQRFITGGANERGYRLLSSPVHVGATNFVSMNYLINSAYLKGSGGTTGGFDGTGNPNLYLYRENLVPVNTSFTGGNYRGVADLYPGTETVPLSATNIANTTYTMDIDGGPFNVPVGGGYLFFFRGARSAATLAQETALSYIPTSATLTATGTLNQGAITATDWYTPASTSLGYTLTSGLTGVEGYNLVGNPYASSIDFDTFSSSNAAAGIYGQNIDPLCYIFDALSQNYNVYAAGSGGVGTIAAVNSNIIPSGQGFFVVSFSNTASKLVFNEAAKTNTQATAAVGNLFLGTPAPAAVAQNLHIMLTRDSVTSTVSRDGSIIIFDKSASTKYVRGEDAPHKAGNGSVGLASMSADSIALAINKMPFPTLQTQKIPLTVTAAATGLYQLNMTPTKSIPALYTMWLKDAYKQDSLDIRANPIYSFNIDKSDTASFGANRFSLVMSENPALMVHLLDFNATKATGGSQVVWKTENEQNYTNFTVERSIDGGVTFAVLGGYASSAIGTYSFLDPNPAMKANQYRLMIQDLNGTITYSKVVTLIYGNGDSPLTAHMNVYPNPSADVINVSIPSSTATNSQTNLSGLQTLATTPGLVSTTSGSTSSYDIKIISITGSVLRSATSASANWQGSVSGLAPGTYIIQVVNNSDKSLVGRNTFVKL